MKRSFSIVLLLAGTCACAGLAGCESERRAPRPRLNAEGGPDQDPDGNALYEDDEGQVYTLYSDRYYPWYTQANGYAYIPGSSNSTSGYVRSYPSSGGGSSSGSHAWGRGSGGGGHGWGSGSSSSASSRGGFGASGHASSGGHSGS